MKNVAQMLRSKSQPQVHSIEADLPMLLALQLMAQFNVGALLVTENEQLVGIVSERDYARKGVMQGRSSVATAVRDFMSQPLISVDAKRSLRECMALMTERHLRHLPVIEDGRLLGLLSMGDLIKEVLTEQDGLILHLEQYIRGEVA